MVEQALALPKPQYVNAVDESGATLLMNAILRGDVDIAIHLLYSGADTEAKEENGKTALMMAVEHAEFSVVEALVNMKAAVNARDVYGETALIKAVMRGDQQILKFLLENGSNYTDTTAAGYNALHMAMFLGLADMEHTLECYINGVARTRCKTGLRT
nr:hypothetical protein BaRGS_023111 [Batillaria attramentaria]